MSGFERTLYVLEVLPGRLQPALQAAGAIRESLKLAPHLLEQQRSFRRHFLAASDPLEVSLHGDDRAEGSLVTATQIEQ